MFGWLRGRWLKIEKFIAGITEKYPKEVLEGRLTVEGNVIGVLYQDPLLIDECDFKSTDFITSDGVFLFSILKKIISLGFSVVDEVTILTSMPDNIVESFQKIGGYETIKNITDVVNIQNTEVYIDNLYRENIMLKLWDDGFNLIKPIIDTNGKEIIPIKLFRKMDSEGVLDWWESRLSSYGTGYTTKILEDNYLDFDDKYFEIAKRRISEAQNRPEQITLFDISELERWVNEC